MRLLLLATSKAFVNCQYFVQTKSFTQASNTFNHYSGRGQNRPSSLTARCCSESLIRSPHSRHCHQQAITNSLRLTATSSTHQQEFPASQAIALKPASHLSRKKTILPRNAPSTNSSPHNVLPQIYPFYTLSTQPTLRGHAHSFLLIMRQPATTRLLPKLHNG